MKSICFITTGDIKSIATAKRALGLANPLADLGWSVSIIMEDTNENRHRVALECDKRISVYFTQYSSAIDEIKKKNKLISKINPQYLYICAFVTRNIVGFFHSSKKIIEHSELQSGIPEIKGFNKLRALLNEYFSIVYADCILNASKYLQKVYIKRCKYLGFTKKPNYYFPYAFSKKICQTHPSEKSNLPIVKNNEDKFFVYLGSLASNYGAFTMLKAFEAIHTQYPNFHLLLLGKGPAYNEILQIVNSKGYKNYIHVLGYIKEEDISTYFSLADAFISPMNDSIQDWARCPSKLYMYLPYKKPIITCKIGEPYETLKEEGTYFIPSSDKSLAEAIIRLAIKNKWHIDIDASCFQWEHRAKDLDFWINNNFKI